MRHIPRQAYRLLLLTLFLLLAMGCRSTREEGTYYAFQELTDGVWKQNMAVRFQLLFTSRASLYQIQIALRMDNRMEQMNLSLKAELQRNGYTYYTDTLRFHLADQPERWLRPGVLFHEYQAGLARALRMPYTGLFELRLTTLDERPLTGVSAVGLRMKERP